MNAKRKQSKPAAKAKRKRGQPRKYQPAAVREKVYEAIASGLSLSEACRSVGATYRAMLQEAERDPEFAEGIERAKEERVTRITAAIFRPFALDPARLSPKEITAIAIHGVRVAERIPEMRADWSKSQRVELTGEGGRPIEIETNHTETRELRIHVLTNDPEYIEYLRQRSMEGGGVVDGRIIAGPAGSDGAAVGAIPGHPLPGAVGDARDEGHGQAVANGKTPGAHRPGTNGHSNGKAHPPDS